MQSNFHQYEACIEACLRCASACNNCASSCTREVDVQSMAMCIQLSMECACACYSAAQLMSLGSKKAEEVCRICAQLCDACGIECAKYDTSHCQLCAELCMQCAAMCKKLALQPHLS